MMIRTLVQIVMCLFLIHAAKADRQGSTVELCQLAGRLAARSNLAGSDEARRSALYREVAPNRMTQELAESMIDVGRMTDSSRNAFIVGERICWTQMRGAPR